MDQANEVYAEDYKALQETLKHYPQIQILSVEKDPPEQYVIEYKIFGYGYTEDGSVQMARRHKVEINLPFGYPHFPPTVKPISRICHPDVDENAIRIADYWQQNQSLADLVIHVAHMIRGAEYSTEVVFNARAAQWYNENSAKLPLGELDYIHDPEAAARVSKGDQAFPVKAVVLGFLLLVVVAGGGIAAWDVLRLSGGAVDRQELENLMDDRKFDRAEQQIKEAIESLNSVVLLSSRRDSRLEELNELLGSTRLQEGLQGRVEVDGKYVSFAVAEAKVQIEKLVQLASELAVKGDLRSAIRYYSDAEQLAVEHDLPAMIEQVKNASVNHRLDYYLNAANGEYSAQGWQKAGEHYGKVVMILTNEGQYLTAEQRDTFEKIEQLRVLALANYHREEAVRLERQGEYQQAADNYRAIDSIVTQSRLAGSKVLTALSAEALQEAARMEEQVLIVAGNDYLLQNYKELFKKHYPGLHGPSLQSPRTKYIGRSGNNLVFLISCIELIQRNSNEYRLFYQYDPTAESWSLYRERK